MQQRERSPSESLFWPVVWAVALHVIMFAMLFVSFAFAPDLPPAKPVVQATLYKLQSQSQATTQTNQKIAGEQKKTSAPVYETEQLEQKKAEQEKVAAKAAEQKKAQEAQKAEAVKKAEAAKKAEAQKKAAEQKKLADVAKKKSAEEAAKKKAAEDAKKKAAEDAKKKAAAEAAKKKAADDAKKKAAAEAAQRKAVEDKKAAALAELLSEDVGRQQALADTVGDQVAGSIDDKIIMLVSQQWRRPPSARNGMSVEVLINFLPDGTVTNVSITRSSGDTPFDSSAIAAVRNVGRITEMQTVPSAEFNARYRNCRMIFKPEDLDL